MDSDCSEEIELIEPSMDEKIISKLQFDPNTRPDLRIKKYQIDLAHEEIGINRGSHIPNIDLASNYYLLRTGILEDSQWDVMLSFSFPIFSGGVTHSRVKEATLKKNQLVLETENITKNANVEILQTKNNYESTGEQLKLAEIAVKDAHNAYISTKNDYQYGLATNQDLLTSLNFYIETKKSYDRIKVKRLESFYKLLFVNGITI
jgi:outer membrane protein